MREMRHLSQDIYPRGSFPGGGGGGGGGGGYDVLFY